MMTVPCRMLPGAWVPALCAGVALLGAGCAEKPSSGVPEHAGAKPFQPVENPGNARFYKADGAFAAGAAKEAYYDMMRAYGYPIPPTLRTDTFWVADFLQRDFEKLGMGGIFWMNVKGVYGESGAGSYAGEFKDDTFGFLGHDIYLLPGQMLPEHRHVGGEQGYGPKMEGWHVRHGSVALFGEDEAGDETPIADMPESARPVGYGEPWLNSKYVAKRSAGGLYKLGTPESWHFMRAGPNGAIVTEYATYHNQVEFSKPGMKFASSGPTAASK